MTEVTPTISFETENFSKQNFDFTVFDMSGQQNYRALWEKFYSEVDVRKRVIRKLKEFIRE